MFGIGKVNDFAFSKKGKGLSADTEGSALSPPAESIQDAGTAEKPTGSGESLKTGRQPFRRVHGAIWSNCFQAASQIVAVHYLRRPYGPALKRMTRKVIEKAHEIMGHIYYYTNDDSVAAMVSFYFPSAMQVLVRKNSGHVRVEELVNMAFTLYTGNMGYWKTS